MLSLTVPLALKVATAEMSVLMAYVRYWVCFLNLQFYKIMIFINSGSQMLWAFAFVTLARYLVFICDLRNRTLQCRSESTVWN